MIALLHKFNRLTGILLLLMIFTLPITVVGQTVSSDKADYGPGETAIILGEGWLNDSIVNVHFNQEPEIDHVHDYHNTVVNPDGSWRIEFPITDAHLGVAFTVVVDGQQSGYQAITYFTDGMIFPSGISSSSGDQELCPGATVNPLVATITTCEAGGGADSYRDITYTWFYNTTDSNEISASTQTVQTTNTTAATNSTSYTPPSNFNGTRYYFSQVNFDTANSGNSCGGSKYHDNPYTTGTIAVTVENAEAPIFADVPADQLNVAMDAGACGAVINWTDPTANDNCDGSVSVVRTDATGYNSGDLFVEGSYTLSYSATDSQGNVQTASFAVSVNTDAEAPVLTAAEDQDVNLDADCSVTIPDLVSGSSATDNCGATITQSPLAGAVVGSSHDGTIDVTLTATDAAGNTDDSVVTLTAKDVTASVLTAEADQDVNLDENCVVTIPNLVDGSTATDNCTYTITQSPAAGEVVSSEHNGAIEVTVTATDAAGNTDDSVVTLTAKDVTDPVLTAEADQDVNLDANCSVTIPNLVDGSTATDNCTYTITQSPAAGTLEASSQNGTIEVTVTATDAAGNTDAAIVTLTAKDVTDPVLTAEADQDVDLDENCAVTIPNLVDGSTATDNCTYTITQSPAAGTVEVSSHNGTIEVTVTATDAAGNTDAAIVTLTAKDVTDPVLTAEADQDVNLDANCSVTIPNLVDGSTATDNCTYTITQSPAAGTLEASSQNGTIEVTVTATDAAGNTDAAIVTLTAKDVTDPVLTAEADQDVDLDENCAVTIPNLVDGSTATDNCTYTITQSPAAGEVISSEHNGAIEVIVTATDAAGNTDDSVVTLTAKDVTAPVLTAEADQDVDFDAACSVTIPDLVDGSTATDNCTYTITQSPVAGEVVSSEHNGAIEVTVTATDAAGNTDDSVVSLTAKDVTAPVLTAEADQDVDLDAACSVTIPDLVDGSTATDNCTYTITQSPAAGTVEASSHNGTIEVTVTATDAAGNFDAAIVTLTAKDVTAPVLTAEADQDVDLDAACSVTIPDLVDGSTATDNCTYTITQSPVEGTLVASSHNGTIEVTVTATDAAGNFDAAIVTLTAKDVTAPVLTAEADQDVDLDAACSVTIPDLVDGSTATDNCTYTITQNPVEGTLVASSHNGTIEVTVTATDAAGNFDAAIVTLTAKDVTAPVLTAEADQDVDLDAACSVTIPDLVDGSTATDNCTYTITQSPAAGTVEVSSHNGSIEVTVTATDAAGNFDAAIVTLTAKDVTDPILTAEADQDVDLDANCAVTIPNLVDGSTATDNCTYTITQSPAAGTVEVSSHNGTVEVTVTATDAAGNFDAAIVTLTAKDVTAPVLTAAADQDVTLGENCSIIVPDVTGTATDNCEGTTITQLPAAGTEITAIDGQEIEVVVTAEDAAGNTDEATVVLTAQDLTDPVLTAAADQDVTLGENCSIIVPDVTGTATDNCEGTTITQLPAAGTEITAIDGQEIEVVVTAEDAAGNTNEATVVLTAQDETDPTITCVEDQTRANDPGTCTYTVIGTEFDPIFDDNCSGATVSNDYNNSASLSGAIFEEGDTTVKWTVTDASGNKTTCSFKVTVTNEVPVINNISGPVDPVQVNTGGVELTATYTDNNVTSATWKLITNDGVVDHYTCEECVDNGIITGSFNPQPGVYTVELTVTDACGALDTFIYEYIVIFDPSGGFVTGGGWIESLPGASLLYPNAYGKANFGFNAKYKNGKNNITEVDGHTNFQFKAGDLHFSSFKHEDMSLVIASKKATYTGYGTVNGSGVHRFRVIAIDGHSNGGSGPDEFRIKIWGDGSNSEDNVLYDNMRGTPESSDLATVLGGGAIVIHKPKGGGNTKAMEDSSVTTKEKIEVETEPMEILNNLEIAPNPVSAYADIRFSLKERLKADLRIYDLNGKLIKNLYSGVVNADQVIEVGFERENLMSGIYICKLLTGDGRSYEKQIVIK